MRRKRFFFIALATTSVFFYLRSGSEKSRNERVNKSLVGDLNPGVDRQGFNGANRSANKKEEPRGLHPMDSDIKAPLHPNLGVKSSRERLKRQLKVYVYNLPDKFNTDIYNCVSDLIKAGRCYLMWEKGLGAHLYTEGEMNVHNTHQFSLEVILHHQLLNSKYITRNPDEADLFYIPAYLGIRYFCHENDFNILSVAEEMFQYLQRMPYFGRRPHLSAIAKIESELAMFPYPLLQNKKYRNVTCIEIEKTPYPNERENQLHLNNQRVIVAPYPSYVHLNPRLAKGQTISSPTLTSRRVFIFLATSKRRSNPFRNTIVDQFSRKVKDISVHKFLQKEQTQSSNPTLQIWFDTEECIGQQENLTISWMQNSVFCLQPHGDSPTRKSFYDSILSGCIPVIFKFQNEQVEYPFQRVLNYSDFVVTIDAQRIEKSKELVVDILKTIPFSEINRLHNNVLLVARQLQYSILDTAGNGYADLPYVDALDMIIEEARHMYGL